MKVSFAEKIKSLFSGRNAESEAFFDDLGDALIEGDVGAKFAMELIDSLEESCRKEKISGQKEILLKLKELIMPFAKEIRLPIQAGKTNIWMLLGVNGVGKTTSAAKLALMQKNSGLQNVILCASDTFRAAAVSQLESHGEKLGIRVVAHQMGSDPAAVVFDAADSARAHGGGLVIADTAGRLHNKENLVRELEKIDRVCSEKADDSCYKKLLVLDATTGQNALRQAEVFNEAVGVDALVLTKCDSSAKGGVAFSIGKALGIPTAFVCTGEGYSDIGFFDAEKYVDGFLGL
ncbi:MAG: signal recognition particle-docking protein FtsY [Treponema sp.]|nr:signal recognition particle-docking protein FtsY [Treponema sp.]